MGCTESRQDYDGVRKEVDTNKKTNTKQTIKKRKEPLKIRETVLKKNIVRDNITTTPSEEGLPTLKYKEKRPPPIQTSHLRRS